MVSDILRIVLLSFEAAKLIKIIQLAGFLLQKANRVELFFV